MNKLSVHKQYNYATEVLSQQANTWQIQTVAALSTSQQTGCLGLACLLAMTFLQYQT